jgi:hypothetical protein
MKDIIIISMFLAITLGGCTRSINPEYEPFIEELERTDRIYDLSNASDSNVCRLAELVDKDMRSGQIRKSISKGVDEVIERRNLDCSKPFPQYERKESAKEDESDLMKWLEELIGGN